MGKMKNAFMEIRERQCQDNNDDYFELISEEEFEAYVRKKYGYGLTGRMILLGGEKNNIINLDDNAQHSNPNPQ